MDAFATPAVPLAAASGDPLDDEMGAVAVGGVGNLREVREGSGEDALAERAARKRLAKKIQKLQKKVEAARKAEEEAKKAAAELEAKLAELSTDSDEM